MRKCSFCCRPVSICPSVCPSICHVDGSYCQTSFHSMMSVTHHCPLSHKIHSSRLKNPIRILNKEVWLPVLHLGDNFWRPLCIKFCKSITDLVFLHQQVSLWWNRIVPGKNWTLVYFLISATRFIYCDIKENLFFYCMTHCITNDLLHCTFWQRKPLAVWTTVIVQWA